MYIHNLFPLLPLSRLSFLYNALDQDLEHTKEFLIKEFKEYYHPSVSNSEQPKSKTANLSKKSKEQQLFSSKVINSIEPLKTTGWNMLMQENNRDLENECRLFSIYNRFLSHAKSSNSLDYVSSYSSLRKSSSKAIEYLKERAIYIAFKAAEETGFKKLDLHYLYLEDALTALQIVIDQIRHQFSHLDRNNFLLEVVTGKGIHSRHYAVLYPEVQSHLRKQGYRVIPAEGKMTVYVTL